MREKDFQTQFGKRNKIHGVFELKFTKGKSIPFNALAVHQEDALLRVSGEIGLYHKITDQPVFAGNKMRFQRKKPFDCFNLFYISAYVVAMFWEARKKKNVYYISIRAFRLMRQRTRRKSFTEDMAKKYSIKTEDYTVKTKTM